MKKNIILLSGVDSSDNYEALAYIKEHYSEFKKLCFIPADEEGGVDEFKQIKKDFKAKLKCTKVVKVLLDETPSLQIKKQISDSDILFLGGGNTFDFFERLQKKKLYTSLKKHLKEGKLIIGLSAGAILLTPSLMMACYPSKDADEYEASLKDLDGFDFLPFEVCPHYKASSKMNKDLVTYSALHNYPLYGIKDGGFVAVGCRGNFFSAKTALFYRGEKVKLF